MTANAVASTAQIHHLAVSLGREARRLALCRGAHLKPGCGCEPCSLPPRVLLQTRWSPLDSRSSPFLPAVGGPQLQEGALESQPYAPLPSNMTTDLHGASGRVPVFRNLCRPPASTATQSNLVRRRTDHPVPISSRPQNTRESGGARTGGPGPQQSPENSADHGPHPLSEAFCRSKRRWAPDEHDSHPPLWLSVSIVLSNTSEHRDSMYHYLSHVLRCAASSN